MKFKFPEAKPFDEDITKIETWYDTLTRCWVIQKKNAVDYQVGEADYAGNKEDAAAVFVWAALATPTAEQIFPKSLRAAVNARLKSEDERFKQEAGI